MSHAKIRLVGQVGLKSYSQKNQKFRISKKIVAILFEIKNNAYKPILTS